MISDRYEIIRAGNQTFLLNRFSGETHLIDGLSLVTVHSPTRAKDLTKAGDAKNWPQQTIRELGIYYSSVRTKYRDGKMLYSVQVGPFQDKLEQSLAASSLRPPTIHIAFFDGDGFQVGEQLELKLREATQVVSDKGEVVALAWSGSQPMTLEAYVDVSRHNLLWSGVKKE